METPSVRLRVTRAGGIAAVGIAIAVLLLGAGPSFAPAMAGGAPIVATAGAGPSAWAYGGQANYSLNVTTNHTSYSVYGALDFHTVLTQTNSSATTFFVTMNRTLGFAYTAQYCSPACGSSARVEITISVRGMETDSGTANFTRNGTVEVNGSAVTALAITNSTDRMLSLLNESSSYALRGPLLRNSSGTAQLAVSSEERSVANFSPALGLVPTNLYSGEHWNSTSAFDATGSGVVGIAYRRTASTLSVPVVGNVRLPQSSNLTGTVALQGVDDGSLLLVGGLHAPILRFLTRGALAAQDGLLWAPAGSNLFGAGSAAYAADSAGGVSAGTTALDWGVGGGGRLGLAASAVTLAPAPDGSTLLGTSPSSAAGATVTGAMPLVGGASEATVQGEPESVGAAQAGGQCIISGACPSVGTAPAPGPGPSPPYALFLVGATVVVLVALLAGLVVARRRSPPRGPSPIAGAGSLTGAAPLPPAEPEAPRAANGAGPSPADPSSDPLSHLW